MADSENSKFIHNHFSVGSSNYFKAPQPQPSL